MNQGDEDEEFDGWTKGGQEWTADGKPRIYWGCYTSVTWGQRKTEAYAHLQLSYAVHQDINFID